MFCIKQCILLVLLQQYERQSLGTLARDSLARDSLARDSLSSNTSNMYFFEQYNSNIRNMYYFERVSLKEKRIVWLKSFSLRETLWSNMYCFGHFEWRSCCFLCVCWFDVKHWETNYVSTHSLLPWVTTYSFAASFVSACFFPFASADVIFLCVY